MKEYRPISVQTSSDTVISLESTEGLKVGHKLLNTCFGDMLITRSEIIDGKEVRSKFMVNVVESELIVVTEVIDSKNINVERGISSHHPIHISYNRTLVLLDHLQ